jgi:serine protease inhibitor ecotin
MIDTLVENTMKKAIIRFGKESNSEPTEHQILITYNAELDCPRYKHLTIGGYSKEITFLEILGLKFDLMQRELIVKEFINKTLHRFAKEQNSDPTKMFVILSLNEEDVDEVKLHLYNGKNFIKEINLEQLIGM